MDCVEFDLSCGHKKNMEIFVYEKKIAVPIDQIDYIDEDGQVHMKRKKRGELNGKKNMS